MDRQQAPSSGRRFGRVLRAILAVPALLLSVALLAAVCLLVHPADEIRQDTARSSTDLSARMTLYANHLASSSLQDLTKIKKIYALEEDALLGQPPDPSCYGSSADPAEIEAVIASAAELLDGQDLAWRRDLPFAEGTETRWYADETILVLAWEERVNGVSYVFSEVKLAHPSQFLRILSGNSYGSSMQIPCTELAASTNAVLAWNGDFYLFRVLGVNVYRGGLYRCYPGLDNCFVDEDGNLLMTHRDELTEEEAAQRYLEENRIRFSLSFGPILVEDGTPITWCRYPIGQVDTQSARSAIGQLGQLHYLLTIANYTDIVTVAGAMAEKNVVSAYALDGGQTAEAVLGGQILNRIIYDSERRVSDIICFVSALPPKEGRS